MNEPLIIGSHGYVSNIDSGSGTELWRTKLLPGLFGGTSGTDVTVLLRGQKIYAGTHGNLFCLDLNSGQILWHNKLEGMNFNDVALAMEGVAIQVVTKVVTQQTAPTS